MEVFRNPYDSEDHWGRSRISFLAGPLEQNHNAEAFTSSELRFVTHLGRKLPGSVELLVEVDRKTSRTMAGTSFEPIDKPLTDVSDVISTLQNVVDMLPETNPNLGVAFRNLGLCFYHRFEFFGDIQDLVQAISAKEKGVSLTPMGHAKLPAQLNDLGRSFMLRFGHTGDLQDITKAILVGSQAVELTPKSDTGLPSRLSDLGGWLLNQFEHTDDLQVLEQAISLCYRAVFLTPDGHEDLPSLLHNLKTLLQSRFERTGDLRDISEAILAESQALHLTPEGHADLPRELFTLGMLFMRRFECTDDLQDIMRAISVQSDALDLTPGGNEEIPAMLHNFGMSILRHCGRTGDLQGHMQAISLLSQAVRLTPEGHPDRHAFLNGLGMAYSYRFRRTGDPQDISEAVTLQYQAIYLTPEGHADLRTKLDNLSKSILLHSRQMDDPRDIEEAISLQSQAVLLTPNGHAVLPTLLAQLGTTFKHRFECNGDPQDIAKAISLQSQALRMTPQGHAGLPSRLTGLATSLISRFNHTKDLPDVNKGISLCTEAVRILPEGHASEGNALSILASALLLRFACTVDIQDAVEAVSVQTQAVNLTPQGHPDLPQNLHILGSCWCHLFVASRQIQHFHNGIGFHKMAATYTVGSTSTRVRAAMSWAMLLDQLQPDALDVLIAFDLAIRLFALMAGLEQTIQRRHAMIQGRATIPLYAACTAFRLDRPDLALEWLEHGRCLVWGQQAQLRTPLDRLRARDPRLADSVVGVSRQLEIAGSSSRTRSSEMPILEKMSLENEARNHLRLAREWEGLLKEVRAIPSFENFLQPLPATALLRHLPTSGHVVVINVHDYRCDAIALQAGSDKPLHIPLPLFSQRKAHNYRNALVAQLRCNRLRARGEETMSHEDIGDCDRAIGQYRRRTPKNEGQVHMVLRCLWDEVVKPILRVLGLLRTDRSAGDVLPRIWWCPTGPLSFLPIHAAGDYRGPKVESAMDYVVSSYTPTVTGLTKQASNDNKIDPAVSGIFLTSQPRPHGEDPIPGTAREVKSIHRKAKERGLRTSKLEGEEVSAAECLEHMERFSSVHLACHGVQNSSEPLKSCFLFHNGRLDLITIMQSDLKNADLAFLSACQTCTGEATLSDEAVHLAAGMLAAGYRRVVATMWGIKDKDAPKVAEDFYDYLWTHNSGGGESQFDGSLSAHALHHAVQELRGGMDNTDKSLLSWIPYVHFGH